MLGQGLARIGIGGERQGMPVVPTAPTTGGYCSKNTRVQRLHKQSLHALDAATLPWKRTETYMHAGCRAYGSASPWSATRVSQPPHSLPVVPPYDSPVACGTPLCQPCGLWCPLVVALHFVDCVPFQT